MNFSYWEKTHLLGNIDVAIIGSGITGLSAAIHLKRKAPNLKVTILERGMLPWGASSKNAGFACFGSVGEIVDDLQHSSIDDIVALMKYRYDGLKTIVKLLGKDSMDYQERGGFELFTPNQKEDYEYCVGKIDELNRLLRADFGEKVYQVQENTFGFGGVLGMLKNNYEGQIDTGKMMHSYLSLAKVEGVNILNGADIDSFENINGKVVLRFRGGMEMNAGHLIICANGFAKKFMKEDVLPARAQVLITKPVNNLPFEGTFHYDKGYYYFRNIHNRVLFGGGRNLDIEGETTTEMECTDLIIGKLKEILATVILPNTKYEIDFQWAGTMGVGTKKSPIIKNLSANVSCAVRLGGMGVALGTSVGADVAKMYFDER